MFHSSITKFAAVAFGAALLAQGASAQNQAHTPVKIIIGFPAGGALDNLARAMAEKLRTELGRAVIVDNKPGASTHIALMTVKRAPADGATILISPAPPFVTHPPAAPRAAAARSSAQGAVRTSLKPGSWQDGSWNKYRTSPRRRPVAPSGKSRRFVLCPQQVRRRKG